MELRYESKEPLYVKIINHVLDNISSGEWAVGQKLPTEDQFKDQFGVSRGTVRRALSELESMGLIIRRPALGTFVTSPSPRLPKALGEIVSFTQQLVDAGYTPQTKVLFSDLIKASKAEGRVLEAFWGDDDIPEDAQVVHIKRLRLGNGLAFAIQSVYFQPEETPGILDGKDLQCLFELYQGSYGRSVHSADELIRVRGASQEEAEALQMAPGEPVLIRDRISYDQNGEAFEVLHSVDHGDRFYYRYQLVKDDSEVFPPDEDEAQ